MRRQMTSLLCAALLAVCGSGMAEKTTRGETTVTATGSDGFDLSGRVKRSGGRVWIDGVERLEWAKGRDCTFIAAMTALAHSVGDTDIGYDYLMGASGMAFRVHMWRKGWCPSAGCAGPGFSVVPHALDALGYRMEFHGWFDNKPNAEARAAMRGPVMRSIDRGYPVAFLRMDDGLIAGYADDGDTLICRTYMDTGTSYTDTADWPWCISVLGARERPMPRAGAVRKSLKLAVEMNTTETCGDYYSGPAAYDKWIGSLRDDAQFATTDTVGIAHANSFMYAVLCDSRGAAARYLESVRDAAGAKAQPHIAEAARIYAEVSAELEAARGEVPRPADGNAAKAWTKPMREREAAALGRAAALERKAVEELKAAIATF